MQSFVEKLAEHGVTQNQLHAWYAMAETVFAVSQNRHGSPKVFHANRKAFTEREKLLYQGIGSDQFAKEVDFYARDAVAAYLRYQWVCHGLRHCFSTARHFAQDCQVGLGCAVPGLFSHNL